MASCLRRSLVWLYLPLCARLIIRSSSLSSRASSWSVEWANKDNDDDVIVVAAAANASTEESSHCDGPLSSSLYIIFRSPGLQREREFPETMTNGPRANSPAGQSRGNGWEKGFVMAHNDNPSFSFLWAICCCCCSQFRLGQTKKSLREDFWLGWDALGT